MSCRAALLLSSLSFGLLLSCGGGGGSSSAPAPTTGAFGVTVTGLPGAVNPSLHVSGPGGYHLDSTATAFGNLHAKPGSYTLTADAVASATLNYLPAPASQTFTVKIGKATAAAVAYAQEPVVVAPNPLAKVLSVGKSATFTATVTGAVDSSVTWSVTGGGSITAGGVYTAPASVPAGAVTVTATSAADPSASGSATVTIVALPTASLSATPDPVDRGAAATLTPLFTGVGAAIDQGIGPVTSGAGVSTGPLTTATTYTLTVVNAAGDTATASTTVAVNPVGVSVTPLSKTLGTGATLNLSAAVTGAADPSVTWSADGGSVLPTGASTATFTAPATPGTYTVTATSVADGSATGTCVATVTATGFAINPTTLSLAPSATQAFTAVYNGAPTTAVTWAFTEGATAGTFIGNLYTAGSTVGTYHLTATYTPTGDTATALVTVASAVSVAIYGSPNPASITSLDAATFYSGVSPSGIDPSVTWTVQEGAGSVVPVAWYDALLVPSGAATYHVIATSVADPSQSATLTVNVASPPAGPAFAAVASTPVSTRVFHQAVTLSDGRILLVGGIVGQGGAGANTPELFDPATSTFTSLANDLPASRPNARATALDATHVLVTGGDEAYDTAFTSALVVDVGAGTVTPTTGDMGSNRRSHGQLLLSTGPNAGKVLVVGGYNGPPPYGPSGQGAQAWATAELFDPATGTFAPLGAAMNVARGDFSMAELADHRVLIAGGYNYTDGYLASAEIYDPVANTFTLTTGSMASSRIEASATLLQDGTVLIAGGYSGGALSGAEIFSPAAGGSFQPTTGPLQYARNKQTATRLANGKVLLTGGDGGSYIVLGSAELYDPAAGTFSFAGGLDQPRSGASATLLGSGPLSGKVLIVGGQLNGNQPKGAVTSP
ncbi:MAG TPA: hypothetical protein VL181_00260 [Holophagaceae bacterium]|nr:hypothetical protein [Holophagaceae bacterium]